MAREPRRFADRRAAGRALAAAVASLGLEDPVVLALPRGGVPVAAEVAATLGAPLDVLIVRKIGVPGNPEYGVGAVIDGTAPDVVLNPDLPPLPPGWIASEAARQGAEITRRRALYGAGRVPVPVAGRCVVLVDDGIATGATVRAALKALRRSGAARIVLAVPVAPADVLAALARAADDVVCLDTPDPLVAVGLSYENFDQTGDEEVIRLLDAAARRGEQAGPPCG